MLKAGIVQLRPPVMSDFFAWAELREASRAHLTPYEPQWTLDELSKLSPRAVSIHLTGEAGVVVRGTVKNSAGTRNVSGPLPLAFVIDPVGETSLDLRLADGQRHSFGIAANGMNLATWTSRLIASIGPTGEFSAQSSD